MNAIENRTTCIGKTLRREAGQVMTLVEQDRERSMILEDRQAHLPPAACKTLPMGFLPLRIQCSRAVHKSRAAQRPDKSEGEKEREVNPLSARMELMEQSQYRLNAQAQNAALERLACLLETGMIDVPCAAPLMAYDMESRLARLRMAHAAYVLRTNGQIKRVSAGVWVMNPTRQ